MSRKVFLAAAMMVFATAAFAQQHPYDREEQKLLWLNGDNVAGIRDNVSQNISYAELYGGYGGGDFRQTYEAPVLWRAGADARTIMHLDRFSMVGGFSFEQMNGSDMCGSMFTDPGYYPVDALEFTPGKKVRQTYAFDGAFSADLGGFWRLGSGLDFESANTAKFKDLRYTDYRLDLKFVTGLTYTLGSNTFGLDYIYRKNSESVESEQIGTPESSYYAFLDKGQYYGKYEAWTGSGVHLDDDGVRGLPLKEHFNGAGLQWSHRQMYFFDFEYLYGSGSVGEKEFVWYRFPSHNFNIKIAERLEYSSKTLIFKENVSARLQKNFESIIETIAEKGVTHTIEYGSNQILERKQFSVDVRMDVLRDCFDYGLYADMSQNESLASQVYPHIEDQCIITDIFGAYTIFRAGKYEFGPEIMLTFGSVIENKRQSESTMTSAEPFRLVDWYNLDTDYTKATKADAKAFLRYNITGGIYVQADVSFRKAFGLEYIDGSTRSTAMLRLGWTF